MLDQLDQKLNLDAAALTVCALPGFGLSCGSLLSGEGKGCFKPLEDTAAVELAYASPKKGPPRSATGFWVDTPIEITNSVIISEDIHYVLVSAENRCSPLLVACLQD